MDRERMRSDDEKTNACPQQQSKKIEKVFVHDETGSG